MKQPGPRLALSVVTAMVALAVACGRDDETTGRAELTRSAATALRGELTVFAAASLTDAFTEIGREFQRAHPGVTPVFNFAASTALRTQMEQGAQADIFASADQTQMDAAKRAGVVDGEDQIFVKNKLIVIHPANNPANVQGIEDLAKPNLKLVLADKNVPAGAYARTALERMSVDPRFGPDFGRKVLANLRSEEANVRAVVTKVQLGEADAAIVYASDVTLPVSGRVKGIRIPDDFNTIATYPIAVVKDGSNKAAARAFIAFVRSAAGQEILRRNNFIVDPETGATSGPFDSFVRAENSGRRVGAINRAPTGNATVGARMIAPAVEQQQSLASTMRIAPGADHTAVTRHGS